MKNLNILLLGIPASIVLVIIMVSMAYLQMYVVQTLGLFLLMVWVAWVVVEEAISLVRGLIVKMGS